MIPDFLNVPFRYYTAVADGVDAAQSLMDAIVTELTALGWANNAYTLTSPTFGPKNISRMYVILGKISATQISYVVRDQVWRQINNDTLTKQTIPLGAGFKIFSGARYLWVTVETITTSIWGCGAFNREPDTIDDPYASYFATQGPITNSGDTTHNNWYDLWTAWNGAGGVATNNGVYALAWTSPNSTQIDHFTAQGTMMFQPAEFCQTTGQMYRIGVLPNALWIDASQYVGMRFTVPLDDSHVGTFEVVRGGSLVMWTLALRVA